MNKDYIRPDRSKTKSAIALKLFEMHDDIDEFVDNTDWNIGSFNSDGSDRTRAEVQFDMLRLHVMRDAANILFDEAMKIEYGDV